MGEGSFGVWRESACVDRDDPAAVARDLIRHINDFLALRDVSPALVGHIEYLLDTFEGEEWQDGLVVPVASYDPWGDDPYLYTVEQLGQLLRGAMPFLEVEAARHPGMRDAR